MSEFNLDNIKPLEKTNGVHRVGISLFVERVVDNELRSYNCFYPEWDYENECILLAAPLHRESVFCTLVLPFSEIYDELQCYKNARPEQIFFEFGLYVMAEMRTRFELKFDKFKEEVNKLMDVTLY